MGSVLTKLAKEIGAGGVGGPLPIGDTLVRDMEPKALVPASELVVPSCLVDRLFPLLKSGISKQYPCSHVVRRKKNWLVSTTLTMGPFLNHSKSKGAILGICNNSIKAS